MQPAPHVDFYWTVSVKVVVELRPPPEAVTVTVELPTGVPPVGVPPPPPDPPPQLATKSRPKTINANIAVD